VSPDDPFSGAHLLAGILATPTFVDRHSWLLSCLPSVAVVCVCVCVCVPIL
jgi:hypothetical protein